MGISVIGAAASSGGGGGGDFVINTGDYSSDTAELSTEYAAGAYGITVSPTDATLDIYLVASDGSFAGYTNTGSITATIPFNKVVVLGSTSSTVLSFVFNGESQTATTKGQLATAGAFVSSVVTSSLPNLDDTTVVNGGNFASDVEVSFIDQSSVETAAKTVVRSSSTQLIITRPDSFSVGDSPFTVKVVNPGIPVPSGSNAHLLSNSVTAGTNPVWTTGTTLLYLIGAATSHTLLATDTEASDIDYSIVSGTLPAGLALDGETGVVSGTFSGTASEGDVTAVTIRAIDTGGNFLDKTFNFTANEAPTWTTAASFYYPKPAGSSLQLIASTGSVGGALAYTLQSGTLLAGTSLNSSGLISGTTSASENSSATFTVRVTDATGLFAEKTFTATVSAIVEYLVIAGGGGPGVSYAGGGGAGGYRSSVFGESSGGGASAETALSIGAGISIGVAQTISIGNGGTVAPQQTQNGGKGGNTVFGPITSIGGGGGGSADLSGASGGSGGGGGNNTSGGAGTSGQGYAGETGQAAGGGGAGEPGGTDGTDAPGDGLQSSITGAAVFRAGGGYGYQGGAQADGQGGAGGGGNDGGSGRQGVVILRFDSGVSFTVSGVSYSSSTVSGKTILQMTSGSGSIVFN